MPGGSSHVTDAELAVLKLLWQDEPLTARRIQERLYPAGTTSDLATVQKLLQRLETKHLVSRDRSGFAHLFRARVTQDVLIGRQLEVLAEKLSDGSMVPLIIEAVSRRKLTSRERKEILELLGGG